LHRRTDYVQANIQDGALCDILMQDRLETVFPDAKTERLDAIASEPDRTTARVDHIPAGGSSISWCQ
jgi:hypothetical protein